MSRKTFFGNNGIADCKILVIGILFIILSQGSIPVNATGSNPSITTKDWNQTAIWNFTDMSNYTFQNTTAAAGKLELGIQTLLINDTTKADFEAGTYHNLSVDAPGSLILGNSSGSGFTDITSKTPFADTEMVQSVAWGDYDNDGDEDLFIGHEDRLNNLFRNDGNGTFTEVTDASGLGGPPDVYYAWTAAWGDYNNDGRLDLIQAVANSFYIWRNNGDGTFSNVALGAGVVNSDMTQFVGWLDYNRDGYLDIYAPTGDNNDRLWRNNKDGTFTNVGAIAGVTDTDDSDFITADIDNDGWADILKHNPTAKFEFFRNNHDGTFTNLSAKWHIDYGPFGYVHGGIGVLDYNNDGLLDVYLSTPSQDLLLENNGSGFKDVSSTAGISGGYDSTDVQCEDFDLDGYQDIFVAGDYGPIIWRNDGDGTFTKEKAEWGFTSSMDQASGAGASDIDNDGDKDIYVGYRNAPGPSAKFYSNDVNSLNFLKFRLVGTTTNKVGIGAKIQLYRTDAPTKLVGMREIVGGTGAGTVTSYEQIFGVERGYKYNATVIFPGGSNVTVTNLMAPTSIQVSESGAVKVLTEYTAKGDFRSRPISVGDITSWGEISWDAANIQGANISFRTRTSMDGTKWSGWSGPYNSSDNVSSPVGRYIQYSIVFSFPAINVFPEIKGISISYNKHYPAGTAKTKTLVFDETAYGMVFSCAKVDNDQTVSFNYSTDNGTTWKKMPNDGNLSALQFAKIALKVDLSTANTSVTPVIDYLRLDNYFNVAPTVGLIAPGNGTIVGPAVNLSWNASDREGGKLVFDIFLGALANGPKVASGISSTNLSFNNLTPGQKYYWYVVAKDVHGVLGRSDTWSFIMNSAPKVFLGLPTNGSILNNTQVTLNWTGVDAENQALKYGLYYGTDGISFTKVDAGNLTKYSLTLEDKKTYYWYITVDDGLLTSRSSTRAFMIQVHTNHPPKVTSQPPDTATVGKAYNYTLALSDPDNDPISVSFAQGIVIPPGMNMTSAGHISWMPLKTGSYKMGVLVSDGTAVVTYYFWINVTNASVNQPPQILMTTNIQMKQDKMVYDLSKLVSDDGGANNITWSISGGNDNLFKATLSGNILTITPVKNAKGKGTLILTAKDSGNLATTKTLDITVDSKVTTSTNNYNNIILVMAIIIFIMVAVMIASIFRNKQRPGKRTESKAPTRDRKRPSATKDKYRPDQDGTHPLPKSGEGTTKHKSSATRYRSARGGKGQRR